MVQAEDSTVGKKGEILPKKALREVSGIGPGDKVLIEARKGELIVKKVYSIEEAMNLPTIAEGTPEDIERDLEEEGRRQEEMTD